MQGYLQISLGSNTWEEYARELFNSYTYLTDLNY